MKWEDYEHWDISIGPLALGLNYLAWGILHQLFYRACEGGAFLMERATCLPHSGDGRDELQSLASRHLRSGKVKISSSQVTQCKFSGFKWHQKIWSPCPAIANISGFCCPTSIHPFPGSCSSGFSLQNCYLPNSLSYVLQMTLLWLQVAPAWPITALHFPSQRFGLRMEPIKANNIQLDFVETTERAFPLSWSWKCQ